MTYRISTVCVTLSLLCASTISLAIEPQVEACVRKNTPKTTSIQKIELRSTDRMGYEKTLVSDIYLKRFPDEMTRLLAYFREPDDIAGTRLLLIENPPENEIYMYMPALFKIRRISSKRISSSMYGSDFSYEDIERFYGMLSTEQPVQMPDILIKGKSMYALETRPAEDSGSMYESVVSYFDKQDCVLQRVDFFESGKKLRKQLIVDAASITTTGNIKLPHKITMSDVRNKTITQLIIKQVEFDIPLTDETFNAEHLKIFRGIR